MTEIRPFAALRFAHDPEPRLAPPWDVIGDPERERLAREPENVVHLTLPPGREGERDYAAARRTLEGWLRQGVLARDPTERLYLLREHIAGGRVRRGLLALLRLADYAERVVLPHERTMAHARRDRLLLTREVRANLEPLFFLYEDRERKLDAALDLLQGGERLAACPGPGGTGLELYATADDAALGSVRSFLADRPVVIADGHHRYDTMLRYRDERRAEEGTDPEAGHEFVLAYLVNAFDPGSEIRAIHRVLHGALGDAERALAAAGFTLEEAAADAPALALLERIGAKREGAHAFALVERGAARLAWRTRGDRLDVEVLHEELLPALGGEPVFDAEAGRAAAAARSGEATLTFLMNPLRAEELFRVVQGGGLLPQKSTYFAPKIPSGLVLRDFSRTPG